MVIIKYQVESKLAVTLIVIPWDFYLLNVVWMGYNLSNPDLGIMLPYIWPRITSTPRLFNVPC